MKHESNIHTCNCCFSITGMLVAASRSMSLLPVFFQTCAHAYAFSSMTSLRFLSFRSLWYHYSFSSLSPSLSVCPSLLQMSFNDYSLCVYSVMLQHYRDCRKPVSARPAVLGMCHIPTCLHMAVVPPFPIYYILYIVVMTHNASAASVFIVYLTVLLTQPMPASLSNIGSPGEYSMHLTLLSP